MDFMVQFLLACFLITLIACGAALFALLYKKGQIESGMQIQCSSGDSEVMTFSHNFTDGEDEESKASKIHEAFEYIQERRDLNHQKWLELKAKAIEDNENHAAEHGQDALKMKALSEHHIKKGAKK